MTPLIDLDGIFRWVLQSSWQAAVLVGLIMLAQLLLRKRLSSSWRYGLWLLLLVRLLMPFSPQSAFSIFNVTRAAPFHPFAPYALPVTVGAPYSPVNYFNGTPQLPLVAAPKPDGASALNLPPGVVVRPRAKIDWFATAFRLWLAGVCFFGARLIWSNARFRLRIGGYQPVADETVTRLFDECCAAFKITQPVRLIESEEVESPAVYGLRRKWLLLPDGVFERFSKQELRFIFLHELAHIKRGDLAANWLAAVLQTLHWFNPVLWLAWARMRADRELATDALALAHARPNDSLPYGETILKVLDGLTGERALPGLVGIVENKAQLKERLVAISRPGKSWKWAALGAAALLAGLGLTGAQNKSPTLEKLSRDSTLEPVQRAGPVVLLADGGPAKGAQVWSGFGPLHFLVLYNNPHQPPFKGEGLTLTTAGADGSFKLPGEPDEAVVIITHKDGLLTTTVGEIKRHPTVRLPSYGRVEGVLKIAGQSRPGFTVALCNCDLQNKFIVAYDRTTSLDGGFAFSDVPAGEYTLYRYRSGRSGAITQDHQMHLTVKAGETLAIDYSNRGRQVIGQAVPQNPNLEVNWLNDDHTLTLIPTSLPVVNFIDYVIGKDFEAARDKADQSRIRQTREARTYVLDFAADGSFHADDIPPGAYNLRIDVTKPSSKYTWRLSPNPANELGLLERKVVVSPGDGPFDVGKLTVKIKDTGGPKTPPVVDFTGRVLDGHSVSLSQ